MRYDMTKPCDDCPFLKANQRGYSMQRLTQFASGEFPCHKTAVVSDETGNFEPTEDSQHCAGALIFNEKRNRPHQMMRICERFGAYNHTKLDMEAPVR